MLSRLLSRLAPALGRDALHPISRSRRRRLHRLLSAIEEEIGRRRALEPMLEILEVSKEPIFLCLCSHFHNRAVAQALTLKILNLCLAKYHLQARSTTLLSRPFGLIVDPSNGCNLACPGCVHSRHVKEMQIFSWDKGMLREDRVAAFFKRYGPHAIHTTFYNYGEPLVNPDTPKFIRLAKNYLMRTMLSTNFSLARFDAEAYVESGLDFIMLSIDGATQPVYEKFRKNGNIQVVYENIRKLVQARRRLRKLTPVITWQYLAFVHNAHEIRLAIDTARLLGVDQFVLTAPFDVSWDDPTIQVAKIEPFTLEFDTDLGGSMSRNWNPFPGGLDAEAIEREFEAPWPGKLARQTRENREPEARSGSTCHWLYKNITMDAGGKIFPCCAAPGAGVDLIFSKFDGDGDPFNSDKYRRARLSFADREAYEFEREACGLEGDPYCVNCEWDKETVNTGSVQIKQYLEAAGAELFTAESLEMLSAW